MKGHFKKNWFWYMMILLLLGGNLYLYTAKIWSERKAKIAQEEAAIECNDRIATITEQNHIEEIKRQASFYASLVREDIYEKSWSAVRKSLENIVKETMITQVDYVQPDGEIEVSTNKRMEGNPVNENLPTNLFGQNATVHAYKTEQGYLLSAPVYQNNMYLGRLLMQHSLVTSNVSPG